MPKINVYLPEDLATAVRDAGISVSPVCQQALAEAVRTVRAAREATGIMRDHQFDPAMHPELTTRIAARMTPRLRQVLRRAHAAVPAPDLVDTPQLLLAVLDEPGNLGNLVLESLDLDVAALRERIGGVERTQQVRREVEHRHDGRQEVDRSVAGLDDELLDRLSFPARLCVAGAMETASDLGHDFLGCEHLVAALAGDEEGGAGPLLRDAGITAENVRRAIPPALAGATLGIKQTRQAAVPGLADRFDEMTRRLEQVEERLRAGGI